MKPAFEQDIPWLGVRMNKDCSFVGVGVCGGTRMWIDLHSCQPYF